MTPSPFISRNQSAIIIRSLESASVTVTALSGCLCGFSAYATGPHAQKQVDAEFEAHPCPLQAQAYRDGDGV